jgi:hypothetical protein
MTGTIIRSDFIVDCFQVGRFGGRIAVRNSFCFSAIGARNNKTIVYDAPPEGFTK